MAYRACPHCGNDDEGDEIYQCENGHVHCVSCLKVTGFLAAGCPICREAGGKTLGEIEEDVRESEVDEEQLQEVVEEIRRERKEASERARMEVQESANRAAERAAYLENNPGDYQCPSCGLKSLTRPFTCCPKCQKNIPLGFWEIIAEQEKLTAERAVVEIERKKLEEARKLIEKAADREEYEEQVKIAEVKLA